MYGVHRLETPDVRLCDCMKPLLPFLSFALSSSSGFLFLLCSFSRSHVLYFQPPALSFSHHHSCCYFTSCLRPGKHRAQTWALSLVSMIMPQFSCFTTYSNLAGSLWMCVFADSKLFHLSDSAANSAASWAQTCYVCRTCLTFCYLPDKENYIVRRCNLWLGRTVLALHCLAVLSYKYMFLCKCLCM